MADIDFGTGPNTPTGDTIQQALTKLQVRIAALEAGGGGTTTPGAAAATLAKLAAGMARVKNGGVRSVVPCIGDSVTDGWGGGLTSGTANGGDPGGAGWSRAASWPHKLAALLTASGYPARSDAFFPGIQDGSTISQVQAANGNNVTFGTGWSAVGPGTNASLSGGFVKCDSGSNGQMTFTPEFSANRFDFLVTSAGGLGMLSISDQSGQLGTIDETQAGGLGAQGVYFRLVTITRAASSTAPITIQRISGGDVYINAIIPYDTAAPRIELLNMGWPGSQTADWQRTDNNLPWMPFTGLGIFNGYIDATLLELGANDVSHSVSGSAYQANLQTIADKVGAYGDVLLVKCHRTYNGAGANEMPANYLTAIDAVQASKNTATAVDFNSLSLVQADYYDSIHLADQGYAKEASVALDAIKRAAGLY